MHEFALRRALGASRGRIFRQLAAEGALVAGVAIAGGLTVAPWAGRLLLSLVPGGAEAFDLDPDATIVVATTAAGLATTFLAVVAPAWRTLHGQAALGAGSRVSARWGARRAMVASQLAAALVLLVIAGLCLTTMRRLQAVPLGFDPSSVLSVELSFPKDTPGATVVGVYERIRARLASSPLVASVSYVAPWVYADNSGSSMGITPADYVERPGEDTLAGTIMAGPDFFDVMRMPVREGRPFAPDDVLGRRRVLLVNETFARKYFGDRSPLGLRVRLPHPKGPVTSEIIGVVNDARHYGVRADVWPMAYLPAGCGSCGSDRPRLLIRTATRAAGTAALRTEIESVDAMAQVEGIRPLDESIGAVISGERLLATLSTVVAVVAITLAALGLYGLVAYDVSRRHTEFGIRLALGATPGSIHSLIVKETFAIAAAGVVGGGVCAVLAARFVGRLVANSAALDWQTLSIAGVGLLIVALIAGWLPASRASHADPAKTLRAE
jgi:predicted permease